MTEHETMEEIIAKSNIYLRADYKIPIIKIEDVKRLSEELRIAGYRHESEFVVKLPEKMISGLSGNAIAEEGVKMYNAAIDEVKRLNGIPLD